MLKRLDPVKVETFHTRKVGQFSDDEFWTSATAPTMELLWRILPLGLLVYLESEDSVPKDDIDRLNVRDNLKMAMEADNRESNAVLLAAGKGIQTAKVAAVKTAEIC